MEGSGENTTSTTREDEKERPLPEEQLRQPSGEPTTLLQSIPIFFQLRDRPGTPDEGNSL